MSPIRRALYSLFFGCFVLGYLPIFFLRGKHRTGLAGRFGVLPEGVRGMLEGKRVLWVHGVSVGEIVQAMRLVQALRAKDPSWTFVVTATTATGLEIARRLKEEQDVVLQFPVDLRFAVRRFIEAVLPKAVVILETEIWPNLIAELSARAVPVYIVNGRISNRAIGPYRFVRGFFRSVLRRVTRIGAQDELSRSRFVELGASGEDVVTTGNMKFDWQPAARHDDEAGEIVLRLRRPSVFLWIAGSTHEGEEETLIRTWQAVTSAGRAMDLWIAPRHLDRLPAIEARAKALGVATERLSQAGARTSTVKLVDRMGILAHLYAYADAVFIGGSLVPRGGHNPVEAAYYGKPVLTGPHMENFAQIAKSFADAHASVTVRNLADLEREMLKLMQDAGSRQRLGEAARRLVARNQGATERTLTQVLDFDQPRERIQERIS